MAKRLVLIVNGDCEPCEEVKNQIDPSIPIVDLGDILEKKGLEKVCPNDECAVPQFAIMSDDEIFEAFPQDRWEELTEEKVKELVSELPSTGITVLEPSPSENAVNKTAKS
jgi:hypothetical protein